MPGPRRFRCTAAAQLLFVVTALSSLSVATAQPPARGPIPREVRGTVKSVDAMAQTITVAMVDGGNAAEKTFTLVPDAEIALGDGSLRRGLYTAGKLTDLAAGTQLTLTLAEGSDNSVISVLAQGPEVRGTLENIDQSTQEITVRMFTGGREASSESQTFTITSATEIGIYDGRGRRFSTREGQLADVLVGAPVTLQLSPDRKAVQVLVAEGPLLQGTVKAIDGGALKLVVNPSRPGEEPSEKSLGIATDATVVLDDGRGRRLSQTIGKLADVPTGAFARVRLSGDQKQAVYIIAEGPNQGGLIKSVDAEKRTITFAMFAARNAAPEEKTLAVATDARIVIDNKLSQLADVRPGDNGPFANLRLSLDQKTIQAITINLNR